MSTVVKNASKSPATKKNVPEKSKTSKSSSRDNLKEPIVKKKKEEETKLSSISQSRTSLKTNENIPAVISSKYVSKVKSNSTVKSKPKPTANIKTSNSKLTNIDSPKTPSSNKSRVTRTQYFPSKNLYSNALKATKSETSANLPGNHIKMKKENATTVKEKLRKTVGLESKQDQEESSLETRPGTATLRKPSIVNANIVGPEVPKIKINRSKTEVKSDDSPSGSEQYESDFDSYESDFEKYSSSNGSDYIKNISGEETSSISSGVDDELPKSPIFDTVTTKISTVTEYEKKLDSGTFDLADFKYRHMLDNIKESIVQENSKLMTNNLASLSDEGFEDQKSLQFINFADAQKKCAKRKETALRKKRGDEILSMIKLDTVNFTIFDLPAVSYNEFIRSYGNSNTVQTSVQTGEDNISEEIQTDTIDNSSKWTQVPITFSNFDVSCDNFWDVYKAEYLGVGNSEKIDKNSELELEDDSSKLQTFLNNTVDLMLAVLTEKNIQKIKDVKENKRDLPFSDGYLQFNTSSDNFDNTTIRSVSVCSKNTKQFVSVHVFNNESSKTKDVASIVCCWDISNNETPQHTFISYGRVSCCAFSSDSSGYIFAGEEDGSILVWDMNQSSKSYDILDRTPTYRSGVGKAHNSDVVAIQGFESGALDPSGYFEASKSCEVCSLDQDGKLIFWSWFSNSTTKSSSLIKTQEVDLQETFSELKDMHCIDMILDKNDVYVSTNYGEILHYIIEGARCKVKQFSPDLQVSSNCLELCPFSASHFVTGYSNGDLSIYSKNSRKPLKTLSNRDEVESSSIQIVKWSKSKPFVLFAKDLKNVLHIWDLSKSEIYPEFSIPFSEKITCLQLSPLVDVKHAQTSYMIIGTDTGKIYMHILNEKYTQEDYEAYKSDVEVFLNYVSRL